MIALCMPHHGGSTHLLSGLVAQLLGDIHWLHICFGQQATILYVCMHIYFAQTSAHLHGTALQCYRLTAAAKKKMKAMQSISSRESQGNHQLNDSTRRLNPTNQANFQR